MGAQAAGIGVVPPIEAQAEEERRDVVEGGSHRMVCSIGVRKRNRRLRD
jgi:hypothetical protein